jgi:chorismate--pyruvate lyase
MDTPANILSNSKARGTDVTWRPGDRPGALPDDPDLRGLLESRDSLTARLRQVCGAAFRLELLGEGREVASAADRALLDTSAREMHVRRISMHCGDKLCVCAGTLMPPELLDRAPWLAGLGTTPLGDALEARGGLKRSGFEFARGESTHPAFLPALAGADIRPAAVWARRSLFSVDAGRLLVYELFLPGITRCAVP